MEVLLQTQPLTTFTTSTRLSKSCNVKNFVDFSYTQKRVKITLSRSIVFYPFRATTSIVESIRAPPASQIDRNTVSDCPDLDAIEVKPDANGLRDEEDAKTERLVVVLTCQQLFAVAPGRIRSQRKTIFLQL